MFLGPCQFGASEPLPAPVAEPEAGDQHAGAAPPQVEHVGVVTTNESKEITAEFEARVLVLHVRSGQRVRAGTPS